MARAFFVFDFGLDVEGAQKARHRVDAWKQAFRLGNKVQFKVDRQSSAPTEKAQESEGHASTGKHEPAKHKHDAKEGSVERVRVLIRLDFSGHEKHLFQTWFERIPTEEPFKSVKSETVQHDSANFDETSDRFDSLD